MSQHFFVVMLLEDIYTSFLTFNNSAYQRDFPERNT